MDANANVPAIPWAALVCRNSDCVTEILVAPVLSELVGNAVQELTVVLFAPLASVIATAMSESLNDI